MNHHGFGHLRVHSTDGFLDGVPTMEAIVQAAHDLGMPAVALTDHDNLHGAIEFIDAATRLGALQRRGNRQPHCRGLSTAVFQHVGQNGQPEPLPWCRFQEGDTFCRSWSCRLPIP